MYQQIGVHNTNNLNFHLLHLGYMRMLFIFTKSNNFEGTIELGLGKPQKLKK